jgi:hypothetical protein
MKVGNVNKTICALMANKAITIDMAAWAADRGVLFIINLEITGVISRSINHEINRAIDTGISLIVDSVFGEEKET